MDESTITILDFYKFDIGNTTNISVIFYKVDIAKTTNQLSFKNVVY